MTLISNKPEYSTEAVEAVEAGRARVRRDERQPGDGDDLRASSVPYDVRSPAGERGKKARQPWLRFPDDSNQG